MRANEIITKVPMNPGEFTKAIDTGHSKGVLVGFEFECCIPAATLSGSNQITQTHVEDLIDDNYVLSERDADEIHPDEFDEVFQLKPGVSKYPNMVQAYKNMMYEKIPD